MLPLYNSDSTKMKMKIENDLAVLPSYDRRKENRLMLRDRKVYVPKDKKLRVEVI